MKQAILLTALLVVPGAPANAQEVERVFCAFDSAPAVPCTMIDRAVRPGEHVMEFSDGKRRVRFSGRSQSGWWSGTLNGKPAMGFERNRGHLVFSTTDLGTTFAWWYKGAEHGSY